MKSDADIRAEIDATPPQKVNGKSGPFDGIFNAAALMQAEFKEPRWAVPGIVPEGCVILAGKPKAGKSWLILDYAVAVASGGRAMGNTVCAAGDVLMLALEDTPRRLHARLKAVLQGEPAPERLHITTNWSRADQGGLDDLRAWLSAHPDARLVLIDTLAKIRAPAPRDSGVYAADYLAIGQLKKIADEFTVPVIVVHHQRKEATSDPLDSVSGTAGLTGAADTIIVLKREPNDPMGMLYVRGRDVHEQDLALEFDSDTGKWRHIGTAAEFHMSEARKEVLDLLRQSDDPLTPAQIAQATGKKTGTTRMLLKRMRDDGEITRYAKGKYGSLL